MRVPVDWLRDLVETPLPAEGIAERLTSLGLEVASVEGPRECPGGVVAAHLREVSPHPGADKLSVCRVWDGEVERQVVCGARNMKAGDGVALARPGAVLPGDLRIRESEIRGVRSEGMLCSAKELGIGEDGEGILILPGDVPAGRPLGEVMGGAGPVIEIELTPNRGDCLSVLGVAREVAAGTGARLLGLAAAGPERPRGSQAVEGVAGEGEAAVRVGIDDVQGCRRYAGAVVRGVRVGPSPRWIAERLQAAGLRPIDNVVDCTNYVMLELGQPLHAFDLRRVRGGRIVVRRAAAGEEIATLDGVPRVLQAADLVIADGEGPVAIAGVMGGRGSGVAEDTRDLFLESACFDAIGVRMTAKRLGLHTDASHRFERGVDPRLAADALERLVELLGVTAGGRREGAVVDLDPRPWAPEEVRLRPGRVARLLGAPIDDDEAISLLHRAGFSVRSHPDGGAVALVPSHRSDVEQEADLVEEVARLYGYDRIPSTLPVGPAQPVPASDPALDRAQAMLTGAGFCEVINYSFGSRGDLDRLGLPEDDPLRRAVTLRNPIREDLDRMRTLLLPSLLANARTNNALRNADLRLFEIRHVFAPVGVKRKPGTPPAKEERHLALLWMGRAEPEGWARESRPADLFDLKGVVEAILDELGARGVRLETEGAPEFLLEGQRAALRRGREDLGFIGRLDPVLARDWELADAPLVFEVAFDRIAGSGRRPRYQAPSRFPASERDLAVVAPDEVAAGDLVGDAEGAGAGLLARVLVADVYRGEPIPPGFRSVLLRLTFQSPERTLTEAEVSAVVDRARERLTSRPGVSLRDR
ncbi:phenylalanine--tRNA ligase subunit beta [Myxococcota bacterium]|nr:phenylalanine--tRNA ligase subunit beta [Myxococcota bacterium]